jgi:hypothetical protein
MPQKAKPRGRAFQKGASGNPNGRPAGRRNVATLVVEELINGEAETVTRRLIEQAKAGEPHALRLFIERVLPPCRERYVQFDLPELKTAADAPMAMAAAIKAVADGKLTLSEAGDFAKLVESFIRSQELTEFTDRLRLLEEISNAAKFMDQTKKSGEETGDRTGSEGRVTFKQSLC